MSDTNILSVDTNQYTITDTSNQCTTMDAKKQKTPQNQRSYGVFWSPLDISGWMFGAGCRTRTRHLMITNQLLYQMS